MFHNYADISMKSHVCLPILLEFLGSFQFTILVVLMQNYSKLWIGGENWLTFQVFVQTNSEKLSKSWPSLKSIYERVAVGRKYLWICLLPELLQSLFHVQTGWNLKLWQSLSMQPFCLWPDENPLAWSGAILLQKKAIILAVNTAILMVNMWY